jgi:hypothetical protein
MSETVCSKFLPSACGWLLFELRDQIMQPDINRGLGEGIAGSSIPMPSMALENESGSRNRRIRAVQLFTK